jgi:hypothetical protein
MRRWWATLGRAEQVAFIGVLATLVVGLLGAVPAYFVFFQDAGREPAATTGALPTIGGGTTSTTLDQAPASTAVPPATQAAGSGVPPNAIGANWNTTAEDYQDHIGETFVFFCPPGGIAQPVWGTDLYTADSSICTAAVHAGRITLRNGGTVTLRIREGAQGYSGSARRGIESSDFGSWGASFEFAA